MNIPLDHECFNWEWSTSIGDKEYFTFQYRDGHFGYYYTDKPECFYIWGVALNDLEVRLNGWNKRNGTFCGPMQPPPSKVILKIREMEARRNHVQRG